ncbi:MAG: hypothetical protein L0Y60_14390 [Beijerinckiaceae bacterium]|nr:hypothetical protein [Beijerinckiaceae bacterium]
MSAIVRLYFEPKRMLTKAEAAHHCGRSVNRFQAECDVVPVRFPNGDLRFDVRDLDQWLDRMKEKDTSSHDDIVNRLG